jgi:hypothetical protein
MKNVHILPTDKPSRLFLNKVNNKLLLDSDTYCDLIKRLPSSNYQNIYITSDEEIKEGDCIFANQGAHKVTDIKDDKYPYGTFNSKRDKIYHHESWKKIILTTDQDLIKDGVQAIDDKFLQWFVKNPSCEWVEVEVEFIQTPDNLKDGFYYKIIIPIEEPKQSTVGKEFYESADEIITVYKQETLEEFAKRIANDSKHSGIKLDYQDGIYYGIEIGAKYQGERMYSEEEVYNLLYNLACEVVQDYDHTPKKLDKWFEQFKKK